MSELPECAWIDVTIHVMSDETGIQTGVKIGGANPKNVYESDWPSLIKTACDLLNDLGECTDARPMTREEVRLYQDDKE